MGKRPCVGISERAGGEKRRLSLSSQVRFELECKSLCERKLLDEPAAAVGEARVQIDSTWTLVYRAGRHGIDNSKQCKKKNDLWVDRLEKTTPNHAPAVL